MITNFDQISAMTALLTNKELEVLASKCEELIKDREHIRREKLRQELMENLQKAIEDILHNGFNLTVQNEDNYEYMCFLSPNQNFSIDLCNQRHCRYFNFILRTHPARFVKIMLNWKIILDFEQKFCYTIIVERVRKPQDKRVKVPPLSTSQNLNLTNDEIFDIIKMFQGNDEKPQSGHYVPLV